LTLCVVHHDRRKRRVRAHNRRAEAHPADGSRETKSGSGLSRLPLPPGAL
jgi:hypothetical protein